jgi:DNA-binding transcriptional LysR family regulator
MDLESVRIFLKVADLASFTRAAEQLGMPKSRVSLHVKTLEDELGSRLLQRTTRVVRPTPDGEQFLQRARLLIAEADDLRAMFQSTSTLRGRVRIDLPTSFARNVVIPKLPEFMAQHPNLDLLVSTTDRRVEVAREGFDLVMRIGALGDSGLTAKRLGVLPMANFASPAYLQKFGTPRTIQDLDHHWIVHYSLTLGGDEPCFEYKKGSRWVTRPMKSMITVNGTDAYQSACIAGLGITQAPRLRQRSPALRSSLVEILPELTCAPMPVSLVHSHGRNVPKSVRAVMTFLAEVMVPALT